MMYQYRYRLFIGDRSSKWIFSTRSSIGNSLSFVENCANLFRRRQEARNLYDKIEVQILNSRNEIVKEL